MRIYRFVPILLTGLGVALVAGALRGPVRQPGTEVVPAPADLAEAESAAPDAAAAALVEQAMHRLSEPARQWLQTRVWLRSRLPELAYEGEGSYLRAPGRRFRLEVRLQRASGQAGRTLLTLSDGLDRWQATRQGEKLRDVERLRGADAGPDGGLLPGKLACGPEPLLRSLHGSFSWVRSKAEGEAVTVTGVWHPSMRSHLLTPDRRWPASLPRICRLTLQGSERWPARLEWWGPTQDAGPDRLLVEMEFREPVWGRPLAEDECARLFTLGPAAEAVR